MKPIHCVVAALVLLPVCLTWAADPPTSQPAARPAVRPPAAKVPDDVNDAMMGEYAGSFTPAGGQATAVVAQVSPQGGGKYNVLFRKGESDPSPVQMTGQAVEDKLEFADKSGDTKGSVTAGKTGVITMPEGQCNLKFTVRTSPAAGAKPPAGAIVLLPYEEGKATTLAEWTNAGWPVLPDGSVEAKGGNNYSKRSFLDMQLHVEFWIPCEPTLRGEGHGNSGVGLMDRYEIQILDSFGLIANKNDCGSVYTKAAPKVNVALPPHGWQTYDITFFAPKWADGKMTKKATVSVVWNGVKVHENQEIEGPTGIGKRDDAKEAAPIQLQFHQHAVRFRNIWVVELKDGAAAP